jgi:hypothetical protein
MDNKSTESEAVMEYHGGENHSCEGSILEQSFHEREELKKP